MQEQLLNDVVSIRMSNNHLHLLHKHPGHVANLARGAVLDQPLHDAAAVLVPRGLDRATRMRCDLVYDELDGLCSKNPDCLLEHVVGMGALQGLPHVPLQLGGQGLALPVRGRVVEGALHEPAARCVPRELPNTTRGGGFAQGTDRVGAGPGHELKADRWVPEGRRQEGLPRALLGCDDGEALHKGPHRVGQRGMRLTELSARGARQDEGQHRGRGSDRSLLDAHHVGGSEDRHSDEEGEGTQEVARQMDKRHCG
mmetsp:Transcript_138276/g.441883  ORF Transcript_138276/g.441883 Transcript_138276/m.441883 type:complete len:255 (+) Transcript_138276:397-1161(+)